MNPSDDADEASKNDPSTFVSRPRIEERQPGIDPVEDAIAAAWRPPDDPPTNETSN